eukprot:TRINITY_DN1206_c0_g1_i1.p1 TRINITY_DN1206_c0_g1~~TRINITY_DN1206_c0_g1_i1.p1  ORF type:complete len:329 (+),score=101.27 TRINITY_DN1206_c0_g1_i1:95-1081(+)
MNIFFGGKKQKTPQELVKSVKELLTAQKAGDKAEELSKNITAMKYVMTGDQEHEPNAETIAALANEIYSSDLLPILFRDLGKLEFEARKDFAMIFSHLLRRQIGPRTPTVEYVCRNPDLLTILVQGYNSADVATNCGAMLRDCIKHEALAKWIMYSENFWDFFRFIELSNFDIASDAFSTFKDLLTKHKAVSAEFLEKNYDLVFEKYTTLLSSANYLTRRQSLKLLGELLLDRANFNIMTRYISSASNLKLMMNLLRDKSRSIQFEAFHVFKVFVANPNKTQPILEILQMNKERLITFLNNFHNDKEEDQFNDEKAFLLKQIQAIQTE